MAYLALYREWRPQSFQEITGQEHVTRTLQNAMATGRVSHAYLFCGPRGTGKTTTAKVLAKAVNCRRRQLAEPCNACETCQEITAGNSLDVIEIDAASHRGIDEIRDLREKVRFAPTAGSYRVYIIDEVHMLTSEAFNALLKTLEEPPAHVIFVLATTEPHKIPLTILSRCQRFDFHRVGMRHLLARLKEVAQGTGLEVEESALYVIARAAEGSLRDALSILDQVAAYGEEKITSDQIYQVLGTVREEALDKFIAALSAREAPVALKLIQTLVEEGKDLRLFVRELVARLRSLLLLVVSPDLGEELSSLEKEKLEVQASTLGREKLQRILEVFNRTEQEMRWSALPRVLLEVALLQAVYEDDRGEAGLAQRVARLEKAVQELAKERAEADRPGEKTLKKPAAAVPGETRAPRFVEPTGRVSASGEAGKEVLPPGALGKEEIQKDGFQNKKKPVSFAHEPVAPESKGEKKQSQDACESAVFREITARWGDFIKNLRKNDPPLFSFLSYGWPQQLREDILWIAFTREHELHKEYLEGKLKEICRAVSSFYGENWPVRLTYGKRPEGMDFSMANKELDAQEVLTLFGISEKEQGG